MRFADMKPKKTIRAAIISIGLAAVVIISYYYGKTRGEALGIDSGKSTGYSQGYFDGYKKGKAIGYWQIIDNLRHSLRVLKIKNLPSIEYDSIFAKQHLLQADIKSFADFYRFAEKRFKSYWHYLETRWKIHDKKKLEAIFYMNMVSGMWGFGNRIDKEKKGCVRSNENNNWETIPIEKINVRTYIESEIGCCSDSAHLLSYLLEQAHIKQRLISFPGHVLNEAYLEDRWYTLDAHTNMMFHSSWQDIQNYDKKSGEITVTIFPHHNLIFGKNSFYRENTGHFRIFLLLQAVYRVTGKLAYLRLPSFLK
jgi:hypothetical protein